MPFILVFASESEPIDLTKLSLDFKELLGVGCSLQVDGEEAGEDDVAHDADGGISIDVRVDLPELDSSEGQPIVHLDSHPRLDREEAVQSIIEEILEQDETLSDIIEMNGRDFMLTFETTPAGLESARALAYVLATKTNSGVLLSESEDEETWWFENAEEFGDAAFGEPEE